ncbi:TrbC/VirB2 family protein [Candidatus Peribacteria bacterium]|nr:TrbC/VirB2 family protein [Candidatus Peribacteria bacterium]
MRLLLTALVLLVSVPALAQTPTSASCTEIARNSSATGQVVYVTAEKKAQCDAEFGGQLQQIANELESRERQLEQKRKDLSNATTEAERQQIYSAIDALEAQKDILRKQQRTLITSQLAVALGYDKSKSLVTNNICVLQPDSDACTEFRLFKEIDDVQDKENILNRLLNFMLRVIPTLGVLLLVIGGYAYIFGDKEKGKSIIMYTVVGLVIAFLSYVIVQYILSFLFRNVG